MMMIKTSILNGRRRTGLPLRVLGLPLLTLALSTSLALLSRHLAAPLLAWLDPSQVQQGELRYDVRDADTGEPIPAKLTLLGAAGCAAPLLTRFDVGRQEGDAFDEREVLMPVGVVKVETDEQGRQMMVMRLSLSDRQMFVPIWGSR